MSSPNESALKTNKNLHGLLSRVFSKFELVLVCSILNYFVSIAVPTFDKQDGPELRPMDQNVTAGLNAEFHCKADAVPDAHIQWYKNGDKFDSMLP